MKIKHVAPVLLAGLAATAAGADFVDLVIRQKTDIPDLPDNLFVCNIYVKFDGADDRMLSTGFVDITTMDGSSFHQDPFGGNTAPPSFLIPVFPSLLYDSFVTIGYKVVPDGVEDYTSFDAGWDGQSFNEEGHVEGGWFNGFPDSGQGDAANYADGEILIAQLVTTNDAQGNVVGISGELILFWQYVDSPVGEVFGEKLSFSHVPAPGALGLLGMAALTARRRRV